MPNLAITYANSVGVKLSKTPSKFPNNYYPTPEKYIVLHAGAGNPSRIYDHYNSVVNLISPILHKYGVSIVQIGKDDKVIPGTVNLVNKTTFRQSAFVLENSLLYFGSDSVWSHVAGNYNIPLVSLYGCNPPHIAEPHYKGDHILLDSHRKGKKPSFALDDKPKQVNYINPEDVANSIFQLLNIDDRIAIKTIKIGEDYNINQIDFIPDYPIPADQFNNHFIVCRMDLSFNLNALAQCLTFYKARIITNKPIPLKVLFKFKEKIDLIMVIVENGLNPEFIDNINKVGIQYVLVSELKDKELSEKKLAFFDYNQIFPKKIFDKSSILDYLTKEQNINNVFATSNRLFLSNGQFYPSVYHWRMGEPFNGGEFKIKDCLSDKEFLDGVESLYIFEKLN